MHLTTDSPLEVEAGDLLTLDFLNMSDQTLFMFVLCIEETGVCVCVCVCVRVCALRNLFNPPPHLSLCRDG